MFLTHAATMSSQRKLTDQNTSARCGTPADANPRISPALTSRAKAYELAKHDPLPCHVIRIGDTCRIPARTT
jgi:hypothetical protein